MKNNVLTVGKISKKFGKATVLDDISLSVRENEVLGLLGPNGAGKSTLTKIMVGLIKPDGGSIKYYNKELKTNRAEISKIVGVVPQEEFFYREFSVRKNIEFCGTIYNMKGRGLNERVEYLLNWLNLKKFEDKRAENLSGGYRRLLNVACSLVHNPKIIFMDEPTVGLDPKMRQIFWQKIEELKKEGKTICLTTHYMDEAQELSDRIAIIFNGKILVQDKSDLLIEKYGGPNILVLRLSKIVPLDLISLVKEQFLDSIVRSKADYLFVALPQKDPLKSISKISELVGSKGFQILKYIVREPELEDVFLNLTGQEKGVKSVEDIKDSIKGD